MSLTDQERIAIAEWAGWRTTTRQEQRIAWRSVPTNTEGRNERAMIWNATVESDGEHPITLRFTDSTGGCSWRWVRAFDTTAEIVVASGFCRGRFDAENEAMNWLRGSRFWA